jgi:hypothetical protein
MTLQQMVQQQHLQQQQLQQQQQQQYGPFAPFLPPPLPRVRVDPVAVLQSYAKFRLYQMRIHGVGETGESEALTLLAHVSVVGQGKGAGRIHRTKPDVHLQHAPSLTLFLTRPYTPSPTRHHDNQQQQQQQQQQQGQGPAVDFLRDEVAGVDLSGDYGGAMKAELVRQFAARIGTAGGGGSG